MTYKLFWCATPDHDEDWFVVAKSAAGAKSFKANDEGYQFAEVSAEYVTTIPEDADVAIGWPSDETLVACGAHFRSTAPPRSVTINGRTYIEGFLDAQIDHALKKQHGSQYGWQSE